MRLVIQPGSMRVVFANHGKSRRGAQHVAAQSLRRAARDPHPQPITRSSPTQPDRPAHRAAGVRPGKEQTQAGHVELITTPTAPRPVLSGKKSHFAPGRGVGATTRCPACAPNSIWLQEGLRLLPSRLPGGWPARTATVSPSGKSKTTRTSTYAPFDKRLPTADRQGDLIPRVFD